MEEAIGVQRLGALVRVETTRLRLQIGEAERQGCRNNGYGNRGYDPAG